MGNVEITYRFSHEGGANETFDLKLDQHSLELLGNVPDDLPNWTELGFRKCPQCKLDSSEHTHCPAASNLVNLVRGFSRVLSHEWITVEVLTAERAYSQQVPAQRGISSLMGLIMAVSGCPSTAFFRPMARFHVPWSSQDETTYRATSMYLLAQFLRKAAGLEAELELEGLAQIYEEIRTVNRAFAERLRAASHEDSTINALVVLDTQALTMPWSIESSLEELRPGFESYLKT